MSVILSFQLTTTDINKEAHKHMKRNFSTLEIECFKEVFREYHDLMIDNLISDIVEGIEEASCFR